MHDVGQEQVFPIILDPGVFEAGLTKREYFAGLAMQGLLANPSVVGLNPNCGWGYVNCDASGVGGFALAQADALLAELAKPKEATNVNTDPIPSPPKMTMAQAIVEALKRGQCYVRSRSDTTLWPICMLPRESDLDDWEAVG